MKLVNIPLCFLKIYIKFEELQAHISENYINAKPLKSLKHTHTHMYSYIRKCVSPKGGTFLHSHIKIRDFRLYLTTLDFIMFMYIMHEKTKMVRDV